MSWFTVGDHVIVVHAQTLKGHHGIVTHLGVNTLDKPVVRFKCQMCEDHPEHGVLMRRLGSREETRFLLSMKGIL